MNEDLRNAVSIHLRASLVPAAAVIPAQVAYFDVVAVKKLVVGWLPGCAAQPLFPGFLGWPSGLLGLLGSRARAIMTRPDVPSSVFPLPVRHRTLPLSFPSSVGLRAVVIPGAPWHVRKPFGPVSVTPGRARVEQRSSVGAILRTEVCSEGSCGMSGAAAFSSPKALPLGGRYRGDLS